MKYKIALFGMILYILTVPGCSKANINGEPKIEVTSYSEKLIEVKPPLNLDLSGDSGNMEIYTWDRNAAKFEMTKAIKGAQKKDFLEKKLNGFSTAITQSKNSITYRASCKGGIKNPGDKRIDLKVYIPKQVQSIKLKLDTGCIKFYDDIKCRLDADIDMASIDINRFDGLMNIKGDMCSLRMGSGVLKGGSNVTVNVGSIELKAQFEENGKYNFETGMGNINLSIPSGQNVNLECMGAVETNEFTPGPFSTRISVKSGMGKIFIRKY
ncbi:MAG: hypothetical protein QHH06_00085 [Clostridiales bacterium]|jgi:hypothetical protein|nr:hypothetical protein [Eubacteriales bacterium]MDH7564868.1 hypothetical protein [Clostridiales bacterium]